MHRIVVSALAILGLISSVAFAQPGANAAVDGRLGLLGPQLAAQGRVGTYPTGSVRFSMSTTSCNPGMVNLPWLQAPDLRHPYIAFMAAKLEPGATRLTQVSDRSFLKHGFFALSNNQCSTCQCSSNGTYLGIACSDTYSTGNNASNLASPDDINPWTGIWTPGSQPNGGQSNTVRIADSDANNSSATYYYCAQYVFPQWTQVSAGGTCPNVTGSPIPNPTGAPLGQMCEPDANRNNNLASRQMTITYNASGVAAFANGAAGQLDGSVLQRWTGATLTSNTNGNPGTGPSDGRVYVAAKVTNIANGRYHYEYAFHNRDNKGGVGAIHIPSCPSAVASNTGFHDVDVPASAANDWAYSATNGVLNWVSPAGNSLRWNMIYNCWFDSDAAPVNGNVTLDQATIVGGVAPSFTVATLIPGALFNVNIGPGCSNGTAPRLFATGSPAQATLGNATFGVTCNGNLAGSTASLYMSVVGGTDAVIPPCSLYLGPDLSTLFFYASTVADGAGVAVYSIPVPNLPILEGVNVYCQVADIGTGGPFFGVGDLSNGLQVRCGDLVSNCP